MLAGDERRSCCLFKGHSHRPPDGTYTIFNREFPGARFSARTAKAEIDFNPQFVPPPR